MSRHILSPIWAVLALGLLAACGAGSAAAPHAQITAVSAPIAAAQTAAPAVSPSQPAGIPEGTTAEGYHVLGRADAPVTLVMYSDFL